MSLVRDARSVCYDCHAEQNYDDTDVLLVVESSARPFDTT